MAFSIFVPIVFCGTIFRGRFFSVLLYIVGVGVTHFLLLPGFCAKLCSCFLTLVAFLSF
jgi:hypothetical protein